MFFKKCKAEKGRIVISAHNDYIASYGGISIEKIYKFSDIFKDMRDKAKEENISSIEIIFNQ